MQVYIEYVLLDNFVINFIIITLTCDFLKLKVSSYRVILSSFAGVLFAIFMPFIILPGFLLISLKLTIGLLMISLLKKFRGALEYVVTFLVFLSVTFALGGVCFFVLNLAGAGSINLNTLTYNLPVPIGIILAVVFIYAYFLKSLIFSFYKKKSVNNFLFDVTLTSGARSFNTKAFLDTGNRLAKGQKPIVVINFFVFDKICNNIPLPSLLMGKLQDLPLKDAEYIFTQGVNGTKTKLLTFEIEKLEIFFNKQVNIIKDVVLGLSLSSFKDELSYDVLLNPMLFNF